MISYILQKSSYSELVGLSKDKKPLAAQGVTNGSLFVEMDTGKQYRFDAETDNWIVPGEPYVGKEEPKEVKKTVKKSTKKAE